MTQACPSWYRLPSGRAWLTGRAGPHGFIQAKAGRNSFSSGSLSRDHSIWEQGWPEAHLAHGGRRAVVEGLTVRWTVISCFSEAGLSLAAQGPWRSLPVTMPSHRDSPLFLATSPTHPIFFFGSRGPRR